jgi:hypothetical protein
MTESELEETKNKYQKVLDAMDVYFSKLRTPKPTEDEKNEAEEAVFVLKKLWINAGINITPKLMFCLNMLLKNFVESRGESLTKRKTLFHQTAEAFSNA